MAGPRVGPGAREQLRTFLRGDVPADFSRPRPHLQLLSDFITHHVSGTRPLEAFRLVASFLPDALSGGGEGEAGAGAAAASRGEG
jgi:hypothetical protein